MRKRTLALALSAVLCIGLAGCKDKKETAGESATLTYWVAMPSYFSSSGMTFNELPMYKEYEKRVGIDVEFTHPPMGQEAEKFNLMIASGNLTDIVEYDWTKYSGGISKAVSDGTVIAIDDFIKDSAPNLYKLVTDNDDVRRGATTSDGHYYGFPKINLDKENLTITSGGLWLRKDWLDKVNMEVPETIDEWDSVLRAFKDKLGVNAPLALRVDMFQGVEGHFNNAFNIGMTYYVENGKVKYAPLEKSYEDFIGTFAKWYKDGLLDREFAVLTKDAITTQVKDNKTGAFWAYIGNGVGPILEAKKDDPSFKLVSAPYPVKEKGDTSCYIGRSAVVAPNYACITKRCKDPKTAAKWIDYCYGKDGAILYRYGIEGETYEMVNGFPQYTELITNNPDGLSTFEAWSRYARGYASEIGCMPLLGTAQQRADAAAESRRKNYTYQEQLDAYDNFNKNAKNRLKTILPALEYDADVADEVTGIKFEVETYVIENITRFISGDRPMSEWSSFIKELKSLKVDTLLEHMQNAYESYLNK